MAAAPVPGPLNLLSSDVSVDSFQVSWDHSASDILLYRLSWAPFSGGDTKEVSTQEGLCGKRTRRMARSVIPTDLQRCCSVHLARGLLYLVLRGGRGHALHAHIVSILWI